jgi:hypothetical protein
VCGSFAFLLALSASAADDKAVDEALKQFKSDYKTSDEADDARIAAVAALSRHRDARVAALLAPLACRATVPVRIIVARELGKFQGVEGVSSALSTALADPRNAGPKERPVRIVLLRSLGALKARDAAPQVNKLIKEKDLWTAKAAIDAAGQIRAKSSIEALLEVYRRVDGPAGNQIAVDPLDGQLSLTSWNKLIEDELGKQEKPKTGRELLKDPIRAALGSITRTDHYTYKDWAQWWDKNKAKFKVAD